MISPCNMGRQHAPQPLSLANGPHPQAQAVHGLNTTASIDDSPDASPLPIQGQRSPHRPIIGVASSGETPTLQVVPTPTSTKSPRSPRSPFLSKFNTSKTQAHAQSPSHPQSYFPPSQPSPPPPKLHYLAGPVADTYEQAYEREEYYYPQPPQPQSQPPPPHTPDRSQHISASVSNTESIATTPAFREGAGQFQVTVQQPQAHDEEKHTRSASRFFNFNKPSKSSHQLRDQHRDQNPNQHRDQHRGRDPNQHLNSRHTDGNVEAMSRGADPAHQPDRVSSKSSKHSSRFYFFHDAEVNTPLCLDTFVASRCVLFLSITCWSCWSSTC